ncbi:MAG: NF038215 family lipoprotein [Acinetobacter sp.]
MNKLSIGLSVLLAVCLVGCEKKAPMSSAKTEVRSIHIAGMPVYEKDYRLTTRENTMNSEH